MKMGSQILGLLITMVTLTLIVKGSNAERYVVGDDFGWKIPPNITFYSEWASSKTFQIGDEISFNSTEPNQNVGDLSNITEYNNCTIPGIVFGNGIIFKLVTNGSRFFISTVDNQCELGMKVIITVGSPTNTAAFLPNGSSRFPSLSLGSLVATVLSTVVVVFFNYV